MMLRRLAAASAPRTLGAARRTLASGTGPRTLYDKIWDDHLVDGTTFEIAGSTLRAIATPGHSPGSTCLYAEDLGVVFSGDTLFNGGPGATGRSYSDFDTIIASISSHLFSLPEDTTVHTGHGDDTRIGNEKPSLDEWIRAGG